MLTVLRDDVMHPENTASCMVSVLPADDSRPAVHWFTATPNTRLSMFKPMVFGESVSIGEATVSPCFGADDPAKVKPRFQSQVDRAHALWRKQRKLIEMTEHGGNAKVGMIAMQTQELERLCVQDMDEIVKAWDASDVATTTKATAVFKHMVDIELNFVK